MFERSSDRIFKASKQTGTKSPDSVTMSLIAFMRHTFVTTSKLTKAKTCFVKRVQNYI